MAISHHVSRSLRLYAAVIVAVLFVCGGSVVHAVNNFQFDSTSKSVQTDATLDVPININTDDGVQVIGADIWLKIDETFLEVQSINQGSYFPTVTGQRVSGGKIYIAGILEDTTTALTGDGNVATVLFTPKKTGTTQIRIDCQGNTVSDTSKINVNFTNPQNVIDCSSTSAQVLSVTISAPGSEATPTPEAGTGEPTPTQSVYYPGGGTGTSLTPMPSGLPNSGFFDHTVYYVVTGVGMIALASMLRKVYTGL